MADPNINVLLRRPAIWRYYDEELVRKENGLAELFAKCKICGKKLRVEKNAELI